MYSNRLRRRICHACFLSLAFCAALLVAPIKSATTPPPTPAFVAEKLAEMDAAISNAIVQTNLPGGVLWLEHKDRIYNQAYGMRSVEPTREPMTADTIFDAASLTKVIATTPAIMWLWERGRLRLDDPVRNHLPTFNGPGTEAITVRHLMTHTSGLRPGLSSSPAWSGYDAGIKLAEKETPQKPPSTAFRYSDINYILLGEIARTISGRPLNELTATEIYQPLRMLDTKFLPPSNKLSRIAPTTRNGTGVWRGVVHDPTSRRMGGVAGHAGLFTTAADLARFARMLLNEGELDGVRLFKPETIRLMTSVQSPPAVPDRRGLGWDIDSPYASPRGEVFPIGSYGHTGWTGTSIWVDPFSRTFLIFLSNRNHPTEEGTVIALRKVLGTLAAQAVGDFDFAHVEGALASRTLAKDSPVKPSSSPSAPKTSFVPSVLNGIDVLVKQNFAPLRGLKIGLISNHTGVDYQRQRTIDLLAAAPEVALKALFSPEHGLQGKVDAKVGNTVDEATGLTVFSLYGDHKAPTAEQLQGLDALVFDIQDIGCRFYTYVSTMGLCMEAAGRAGLKFFVLDRVNPINGVMTEGPVYEGDSKFIAFHTLPVRHGMTTGELARMLNEERAWKVALTVIPLEGWKRGLWFDETGLPWVNPSPNMRNLKEAVLYPGIGLLEKALAVGRGTDTPFEIMGAPYIDDLIWAKELNDLGLAGIRFVPIQFTPTASTFALSPCRGVYLMITDRAALSPVDVAMAAAVTLQRLYPQDFSMKDFNVLLLNDSILAGIAEGRSYSALRERWKEGLAKFQERRQKFLLYP